MTFGVCRKGLGNGQHLSVGSSSLFFTVFFCVKMCDGAISKQKPETRKWIHYAKRNTGMLNFWPRNGENQFGIEDL